MTPWNFRLFVKAHNENLAYEHDSRAFFMWHSEALARSKRLPPLKDFLSSAERQKKETGIDQNAIIGRFKAYKAEFDKTKAKGGK